MCISPDSATRKLSRLRFAEQRPPAGVLVETTRGLPFLDASATGMQGHVPCQSAQNEDGIGSARQAVRSADHIEGILRLHFADVMDNDDRNSSGVGQFVKPSNGKIVG